MLDAAQIRVHVAQHPIAGHDKSASGNANPILLSLSNIRAASVQIIGAQPTLEAGLRDVAHVAHSFIEGEQ